MLMISQNDKFFRINEAVKGYENGRLPQSWAEMRTNTLTVYSISERWKDSCFGWVKDKKPQQFLSPAGN